MSREEELARAIRIMRGLVRLLSADPHNAGQDRDGLTLAYDALMALFAERKAQ